MPLKILSEKAVNVYDLFRDHDDSDVSPFALDSVLDRLNAMAAQDPDLASVPECRLEESNGRATLIFQEDWQSKGEPQRFYFRHETAAQVRAALPPLAVKWLDQVNGITLDMRPRRGK